MSLSFTMQTMTSLAALLKTVVENSVETIIILDRDKNIQLYNRAANDYARYFAGTTIAVGDSFYRLIDSKERHDFERTFETALTGQRITIDRKSQTAGFPPRWVSLTYAPIWNDQQTEVAGVCFTAVDTTNQVQADRLLYRYSESLEKEVREHTADLERQRAQLAIILDTMQEAVLFYNIAINQISYANPAFALLAGYPLSTLPDLSSLSIFGFVGEEDAEWSRIRSAMGDKLRANQTWYGLVKLRRFDGSAIDVKAVISPVAAPDRTGDVPGVVVLLRDVSEEQRLNSLKDRFIANAAHEIRTPVAALKLRAYLLRNQPLNFEKHMGYVDNAINELVALTESMLDKARFESGRVQIRRENSDLRLLLQEVVDLYQPVAEQKQITLTAHYDPEPVIGFVDVPHLHQAIANLVVNAIHYTPTAGHVSVELVCETLPDRSNLIITVADSGIGVPPEAIPHLFEPFFRVSSNDKPRGHGLGLAITKEIVDLHRGQIRVESEPGKGSRFIITLMA